MRGRVSGDYSRVDREKEEEEEEEDGPRKR